MICQQTAATKEQLPLLKLARFGHIRTTKNSLRQDANVMTLSGIEADYDAGTVSLEDAAEVMEKTGLFGLIYPSPRHTEDLPKWRVLCPFSQEMTPNKRSHMMGRLNGAFQGIFAPESWTLSQSYYYGSLKNNPSHRVDVFLGHCIDQLDELDGPGWSGPPDGVGGSSVDGVCAEARDDAELIRCAVTGDGYHTELCALAARYVGRGIAADTVAGILQGVMLSHPMRERDARWQDRYESIVKLVRSAVAKYGEDAAKRKAFCRFIHRLIDQDVEADDLERFVTAEAERVGITLSAAMAIADRVCIARSTGVRGNA
jgi:hypothetical protein